jgi:hypothetical protein
MSRTHIHLEDRRPSRSQERPLLVVGLVPAHVPRRAMSQLTSSFYGDELPGGKLQICWYKYHKYSINPIKPCDIMSQ